MSTYRPLSQKGFTLVELMVVVGVVTIITTLILTRYSQFNNTILLSNLAYDIALSARQAQVYGLSVRERTTGVQTFNIAYGLYFNRSNPTSYSLFSDNNDNQYYDEAGDTIIELYNVRRGYEFLEFCVAPASGAEVCTPYDIEALSVTFKRPDPDAFIYATPNAADPGANQSYSSARITIGSPQGQERSISVTAAGQISVGY